MRTYPPKLLPPITDPAGRVAKEQKVIRALGRQEFKDAIAATRSLRRQLVALADSPLGVHLDQRKVQDACDRLVHLINFATPYTTCPYPPGPCEQGTCKSCRGNRWVTKRLWEAASPNIRGRKE